MSRAQWRVVALLIAVIVACLVAGDGGSDVERRLFVAMADFGQHHARVALAATAFGYFVVLGPLSLLLAAWLAWRQGSRIAIVYLVGTLIARLIVELVKDIARRPRPTLLPHLAPASSWSFPSGHAANSMITLLGFALLLRPPPVRPERSRRPWSGDTAQNTCFDRLSTNAGGDR